MKKVCIQTGYRRKRIAEAHELTRLKIIEVHHCTITNGTTVTFPNKAKTWYTDTLNEIN